MRFVRIAAVVLLMVSALSAAKTLDMYMIDVEGSKAFLLVSPSGQSMLIDAGIPGSEQNGRDTDRIVEACKAAGVKQIDYMVVTHYDGDHVGGVPALAARMPIVTFVDHGENVQINDFTVKVVKDYMAVVAKGKHIVVKAGDKIPIKASTHSCYGGREGDHDAAERAGQPNPLCDTTPVRSGAERAGSHRQQDANENAMAIVLLVTYGKFRMLDPADLTWNKDREMFCPVNRIGTVDLYMTANHGMEVANSPLMVHALQPGW